MAAESPPSRQESGLTSDLTITGVLPPMATPFTNGGEVHYAKHARDLGRWNQRTLAGYLVPRSAGDAVCPSEQERPG